MPKFEAIAQCYRNGPAFYLIDKNGVVRYTHFGQGRYRETEAALTSLLKQKYPTENK